MTHAGDKGRSLRYCLPVLGDELVVFSVLSETFFLASNRRRRLFSGGGCLKFCQLQLYAYGGFVHLYVCWDRNRLSV